MSYSRDSIERAAQAAARQGRAVNPFPDGDAAHAVWQAAFCDASAPARNIPHVTNFAETAAPISVPAHIAGAL